MSTFASALYTGQTGSAGASQNAAAGYPSAQMDSGKLRYTIVQYALGAESTNDTINLCRLPLGAKVLPTFSKIECEDPGTALTLDIGDAGDADRYLDGAALTTAHTAVFPSLPSTTAVAAQTVPYAIAAGNEVVKATVVLATALTSAAKITFYIAWVEA
jgi:hypothetical protein